MRLYSLKIVVLLGLGAALSCDAADWAKFGGPGGDFKSPETGIVKDFGTSGPPVVWTLETGEGYCQPTVAAGRVYVFDRVNDSQRLRCLDARTAGPYWEFSYPTDFEDMYGYDGGPRACPVVDGDRVYILGPEGMFHCLGTEDGAVQWKIDTFEAYHVQPNFFGAGAAPVVEGDLLIMQVGGATADSPPIQSGQTEPNGSGIVAFDKRTGEEVYRTGDELASYSVPVFATIHGRRYGFAFARGGLLAFNPADGDIYFHFPWRARIRESVNASNPVIIGDKVFISECYGVGGAMLRITGEGDGYEVLWQDDNAARGRLATHWMTAIEHEGYLYGSTGRHSGGAELRCVDVETGEVKWSADRVRIAAAPGYDDPRDVRLTRCALTMVDGHIIALGEFGQLAMFRPKSRKFELITAVIPVNAEGRELIRSPAWAAPAISNGLMYLRSNGSIICMEIGTE